MPEQTEPAEPSGEDATASAAPEQERPADSADEGASPPPKAKGRAGTKGRGVAFFALLVAAIAVAGVGYQHWLGTLRDARVDDLDSALRQTREMAGVAQGLGRQNERLAAQLAGVEEEQARQRQALGEARSALAEAIASARDRAPADARQWRLAEVEYLLRITGHRLVMERDAATARALLMLADDILAELDDFAFHEVRALLAEDVAALAAYRGADVQGVSLRLEAMRGSLNDLPLRLPEYADAPEGGAEPDEETSAGLSAWDALVARIGGLVRFRRHDPGTLRPLLPPTQADYLEQHLRLAVDRAQLAALRRTQAVFDSSLATMAEWLDAYLDPNHDLVRHLGVEIAALREVELTKRLPDVSRPLRRFMELRRDVPQPARGADKPAESQALPDATAPAES